MMVVWECWARRVDGQGFWVKFMSLFIIQHFVLNLGFLLSWCCFKSSSLYRSLSIFVF
ncbi:hypothetical protein HanIR_Chr04g0175701 [Helianthus annuus]|nr:hypothetical protein HanIR_Chr04g0175701 [Helianthus annuus]